MYISELLQTAPLFSSFNQSELQVLEQAFSVDVYEDGHEFVREDERNRTMFLIIEGEVMVTRKRPNAAGYDLIKKLTPGQVFGLVSLLDTGRCTATCRATGKVRAASLPSDAFELLMYNNASIAHHFQAIVTQQLTRDIQLSEKDLAAMMKSGDTKNIRRAAESRSTD